jgi:hypothetical protein
MPNDAGAADLLQAAQEALTGEVLPALSGTQRYAALMVANALRMVERELATNGRLRAAELAVQAFAAEGARADGTPAQALCAAIRAGRHDANFELYNALYALVVEAVAITRPDVLTSAERQQNSDKTGSGRAGNGLEKRS